MLESPPRPAPCSCLIGLATDPRCPWHGSKAQRRRWRDRETRWHQDAIYHARVATVREWMERADGAAPDELLGYAMDVVDALDELSRGPGA